MTHVVMEASLPLNFQSFMASIDDVFHFLDIIPNSWLHYSFEPSEEDMEKVNTCLPSHSFTKTFQLHVLPTDFQIAKLDPLDLAKAPCSWAADKHYSVKQDTLVPDDQKRNYTLFAPPNSPQPKCAFTRLKPHRGLKPQWALLQGLLCCLYPL
jgi:hypothetical protein